MNAAQSAQWKQVIRQALEDARCASPAFMTEDMDTVTQTVTVQIAIQERVKTSKGARWWDVGPIFKVPVVLPRGGGFSLTLPLKKGTEGLLVFCDTCFDSWWANGTQNGPKADNVETPSGTQRQVEVRRHDLNDCGFIPGMCSQVNPLTNYATDAAQLRSDTGSAIVSVSDGRVDVKAYGGTTQALVAHAFYQYWVETVYPFLVSKGFVGGLPPSNSETTLLKGQ